MTATNTDQQLPVENLSKELRRLLANQTGYKSWGVVTLQRLYVRLANNKILSAQIESQGSLSNPSTTSASNDVYSMLFNKRKSIHVILETKQHYGSRIKTTIPPILDDQAQLLGPSLKYVADEQSPKKIFSALKGRYAVNIGDGRTLCIGKNLEEAFIAAQLVEKTSKAYLGAQALGGAKSINKFEAWAMHKFYMLKYSKESEKNR